MPVNITPLSDETIARGVQAADFSKFDPFGSYFAGADQAQKQKLQNLFSDIQIDPNTGIPYATLAQRLLQAGGAAQVPGVVGLLNQEALRKAEMLPTSDPGIGPVSGVPQQAPRVQLPPTSQGSGVRQTGPAATDTADAGPTGTPAPPGQNTVRSDEVPNTAQMSVDGGPFTPIQAKPVKTAQMTTARSLAEGSKQDVQVVADALGVTPDQAISTDEVRQKLPALRQQLAGGPQENVPQVTVQARPQAPAENLSAQSRQGPAAVTPIRDQNDPGYYSIENAKAYQARGRLLQASADQLARIQGGEATARERGQAAGREFDIAKQIMEVVGKANTPTGEMIEAKAAGQDLPGYQRIKSDIPEDVKAFRKDWTAIQESGRNAMTNITKAEAAKQLTLDPNYTSGPWSDQAKAYQQYRSLFGNRVGDIRAASPIEASEKLANDLVGEGIRTMGQAGVRVLRSEIPIIQRATANQGVTANTNRMLWEFAIRTYQKQGEIAQATQGLPPNSAILNRTVDQYLQAHPFLSEQERQNPNLLGSPNAPPGSNNWAPQQWRNWAASAGLRPSVGTPGQPGFVPGDTIKIGPDTYGHVP